MYLFWSWFAGFFLALCWQAAQRLIRKAYKRLAGSFMAGWLRFLVRHYRIILRLLAAVWLIYHLYMGELGIKEILDGIAINLLSN